MTLLTLRVQSTPACVSDSASLAVRGASAPIDPSPPLPSMPRMSAACISRSTSPEASPASSVGCVKGTGCGQHEQEPSVQGAITCHIAPRQRQKLQLKRWLPFATSAHAICIGRQVTVSVVTIMYARQKISPMEGALGGETPIDREKAHLSK